VLKFGEIWFNNSRIYEARKQGWKKYRFLEKNWILGFFAGWYTDRLTYTREGEIPDNYWN